MPKTPCAGAHGSMYPSKSSVASAHDEIHGTIEKFRHFINVFCRRHALSVLPIVKNGFRNMQFAVTERVTAFMEMLKQKPEALGKRRAGRKFLSFLIIFRGCEVIQRALKAIRYLDKYFDFRYSHSLQITGNRGFGNAYGFAQSGNVNPFLAHDIFQPFRNLLRKRFLLVIGIISGILF